VPEKGDKLPRTSELPQVQPSTRRAMGRTLENAGTGDYRRRFCDEHYYSHSTNGQRHHWDISGNIVLGEDRASLRNLMSNLLSKRQKQIVFNLSEVEHIDSLGFLVSAFTSVRRGGWRTEAAQPTTKVKDIVRFTKLNSVFDIVEDQAVAISSFGQSASANA
jgi:anti-anti-sigma factor